MKLATLAACLAVGAIPCLAHPMGNFSINHYSKLSVGSKVVDITYLIDMAEIPTFQDMREFNLQPDPANPEVERYLAAQGEKLASGLSLQIDGRPIPLTPHSRHIEFAEGAGGLSTMKFRFELRGVIDASSASHHLIWNDSNFSERAGWKEIVVVAHGTRLLTSSAPATDRSNELTNYSSDAASSPPQDVTAEVTFRRIVQPVLVTRAAPAQPPVLKPAPAQNTPRNRFTELISTQGNLSFWVLLSAGLIAAGLGALHALEPGHGKTIVASYLVGSRGTAAHAGLLGLVVTTSHMASVYLLGIATLYASRYIVPDQLYPWLGTISGVSVTAIGIVVFLRHWTGESGDHSHAPGENHSHWFAAKTPAETTKRERVLSLRELCILGITGGIVPCPAALVVLLSAFSLHRLGFGLFLITAFSAGLAFVLVMAGLLVVYAKRALSSHLRSENRIVRNLPLLSSGLMTAMGIGLVVSSGISLPDVHLGDKLLPFVSVVLLGLFLGIRHSTDSDHVVAVTTIVSRQGNVRSSASIGLLWGLGHTITIFIVGSAIIVFRMVIPPRLGLSMEFCVACMLILLGVINITRRQAPAAVQPQTLRPLFVGLVHGLAGSAAVALLVLSTIKSPLWSTAYLLVFGFGTMLGMMLMTTVMSLPMIYAGKKFFRFNHWLVAVSGTASVVFGAFLVYHIGIVDGLFTANVHWTPQ